MHRKANDILTCGNNQSANLDKGYDYVKTRYLSQYSVGRPYFDLHTMKPSRLSMGVSSHNWKYAVAVSSACGAKEVDQAGALEQQIKLSHFAASTDHRSVNEPRSVLEL
jgi:hypothetical protein